MAMTLKPAATRALPSLRWWIGGILFASTVINYVDRQTLSLLAPYLKIEYRWTNTDYANIVIAFRVAYSIGQTVFGRVMDRIGTRRGLTLTVAWYSLVSIATSLARGLYSFAGFRFLLGAGESANWPAATKAVSEWFPKHERGLATALFDSGSSIGGAVAPFIILPIYFRWGWRPAFAIPGLLGFLWLIGWRWIYHPPEAHPRITQAELRMITADKAESDSQPVGKARTHWSSLLKLPQTWGTIIAKAFTDPVWFFVTDWFPIFLVAKGIELRSGLMAVWVPFIAADLGRKELRHFVRQKLYLLCIRLRPQWHRLPNASREQATVNRLVKAVRLPGRVLIFAPSGSFRAVARKLGKLPGARILSRR